MLGAIVWFNGAFITEPNSQTLPLFWVWSQCGWFIVYAGCMQCVHVVCVCVTVWGTYESRGDLTKWHQARISFSPFVSYLSFRPFVLSLSLVRVLCFFFFFPSCQVADSHTNTHRGHAHTPTGKSIIIRVSKTSDVKISHVWTLTFQGNRNPHTDTHTQQVMQ